jgi:hypothetical protein
MQGGLQLALSKWMDPAIPLPRAFEVLELDLLQYFQRSPRERARIRSRLKKSSTEIIGKVSLRFSSGCDELGDLFQVALEEFDADLRFWSIASGFKRFDRWEESSLLRRLAHLRGAHASLGSRPWFFEWGIEDRLTTTAFLMDSFAGAGFIVDLDFHARDFRRLEVPLHFKLHGWHTERWVRRYGPTQVARLLKRMRPHTLLILAHSGRLEEADLFQKELHGPGKR